jgi:uncharacterized protein
MDLGVSIDNEFLVRSGIISDGFPHYVHLIAENLFWSMHDDNEICLVAQKRHFKEAVRGALERTDVEHKSAYRTATQKTKNTSDYETVLWALADKTETQRQVTSIYDESYKRLSRELNTSKPLSKESFNQRLLNLKKESHGKILVGYGAGWFAFRENIMRGYVRLVAENSDVNLARDIAS